MVIGYTMLNLLLENKKLDEECVTVGYHLKNKKMTLNDKLSSCEVDSQSMKLLKISEVGLTTKEKDLSPYWNQQIAEISKKLWLPTKIDCPDLDLTSLGGLLKNTEENSWFSMDLTFPLNKNLLTTSYPLFTSSPVEFMDSGNTVTKSRKIRIYPNAQQRQVLRDWFGAGRYCYNKTVEYLKTPGTKANWKGIKTGIIKSVPDWAKKIPYQIKSIAVRDACKAVSNAKMEYKKTGVFQDVKFKSRKKKKQNVFIPKSAITKDSFYKTFLGEIKSSEPFIRVNRDCRVVLQSGRYFLIVPFDTTVKVPESQRTRLVALDPGIRTFQTFYSPIAIGKIGQSDFGKIQRLCSHLDSLISKISKAKARQKYRMKKAADRLRWRIKDLISEIHFKTANLLCKNFDVIALPPFEVSDMVSKLRSKTARKMLTWSHYRFSQILISKAREYSVMVIRQDESYTSKTCNVCGQINNIGSKSKFTCKCGIEHDRDYNGARGIYLRALGDTPLLDESSICIS